MAVYLPQNSGLWSTTTWITAFSNLTAFAGGNVPPTVIDDVYADGKTIYIDISTQVRTLLTSTTPRTGGLTGGGFIINNAVSLSASLSAGTTTCLTFLSAAPSFCTLYGVCSGSRATTTAAAFANSSSGTVFIFGDIYGLGGNGINNSSSGVVYVVGNSIGGSVTNASVGINNTSTGTIYITGNILAGTSNVSFGIGNSTGTVFISGNVRTGGLSDAIRQSGSGTIYVEGVVGGTSIANNIHHINNQSTGMVFVLGRVQGGSSSNCLGVSNASTGIVSVTGTVIGGSGGTCHGINNASTGLVTIFGNALGGSGSSVYGIQNNSNGVVQIYGNTIGSTGSTSYGAFNNATGYLEVNGIAIGNGFGLGSTAVGISNPAPGIFGSQTGTTIVRGLSCGARGQWPTAGNVFIIPQSTSTATLETSAFQDIVLFTSLSTNIVPPASSVRLGTRYNLNDYTGTCIIPSISSVLQEVAVDNSIGIAALQPQTIWNYSVLSATDVDSLGGRLKEVATVQSVGQQFTALN